MSSILASRRVLYSCGLDYVYNLFSLQIRISNTLVNKPVSKGQLVGYVIAQ